MYKMPKIKNDTDDNKTYKIALSHDRNCNLCPPNKGENAKRKEKSDKYKNKKRNSIRKQ